MFGHSKNSTTKLPPAQQIDPKTQVNEAIPSSQPGVTGVLVSRLNAWKHVVNDLLYFYQDAAKVHKSTASSYEKMANKAIKVPIQDSEFFDQPNAGPGPALLMTTFQQQTLKISEEYGALESSLQSGPLSLLEKLKSEIKAKQKGLESHSGKEEKAVEKARTDTQKGKLECQTKQDAKHDPYLLHRQVHHKLLRQVRDENSLQDNSARMQDDFTIFEAAIVTTIRDVVTGYDINVAQRESQVIKGWSSAIAKTATDSAANPNREWQSFAQREKGRLVDPSLPKRSVRSIGFTGKGAAISTPLREGQLQKKGKMLKKYDTMYYVLTPAGYLHEYRDGNQENESDPSLSIYLPDATIGAHSAAGMSDLGDTHKKNKGENKFNILTKGGLTGKTEYVFKASTPEECVAWWEALQKASGNPVAATGAADDDASDYESNPVTPSTPQGQYQGQGSKVASDASGHYQSMPSNGQGNFASGGNYTPSQPTQNTATVSSLSYGTQEPVNHSVGQRVEHVTSGQSHGEAQNAGQPSNEPITRDYGRQGGF